MAGNGRKKWNVQRDTTSARAWSPGYGDTPDKTVVRGGVPLANPRHPEVQEMMKNVTGGTYSQRLRSAIMMVRAKRKRRNGDDATVDNRGKK